MADVKLPSGVSRLGKVSGYLIVLLVIYVMFLPFIASKSPYPGGAASYALTVSKQTLYLPWAEYAGFILVSFVTAASVLVFLAFYLWARPGRRGGVG